MTLNMMSVVVPDGLLVFVSPDELFAPPLGISPHNSPVSSSGVEENASLVSEVRGETGWRSQNANSESSPITAIQPKPTEQTTSLNI